jgi:hypothetical protein
LDQRDGMIARHGTEDRKNAPADHVRWPGHGPVPGPQRNQPGGSRVRADAHGPAAADGQGWRGHSRFPPGTVNAVSRLQGCWAGAAGTLAVGPKFHLGTSHCRGCWAGEAGTLNLRAAGILLDPSPRRVRMILATALQRVGPPGWVEHPGGPFCAPAFGPLVRSGNRALAGLSLRQSSRSSSCDGEQRWHKRVSFAWNMKRSD